RHEVGAVVQFASGFSYPLLGGVRNGLGSRRTVNHQRDRSGRQAEMSGQLLQAEGGGGTRRTLRGLVCFCPSHGMSCCVVWHRGGSGSKESEESTAKRWRRTGMYDRL